MNHAKSQQQQAASLQGLAAKQTVERQRAELIKMVQSMPAQMRSNVYAKLWPGVTVALDNGDTAAAKQMLTDYQPASAVEQTAKDQALALFP